MEKTISIRNTEITFSIWDLGGQREFVNMLPLVCNDAVAILFMFDLTRKSTLNSIKEWYRQARGFNKVRVSERSERTRGLTRRRAKRVPLSKLSSPMRLGQDERDGDWVMMANLKQQTAIPFLVGTKYDHFVNFAREEQEEISKQARKFARAMKASLIFSSTSHSINVQKVCYERAMMR